MRFRRFTNEGLDLFQNYLERLKTEDPKLDPPPGLLDDDRYATLLDPTIEAEPIPFARRMDFACWLHDAATAAGTEILRSDTHFWAWLSLALFDQVCPVNGHGKRQVNETAWYIPDFEDRRRNYRHALSGSYAIFYLYKEDPSKVEIFLNNPLTNLGHFWYQIVSRQDLIGNPAVVSATTKLYLDYKKMKPKKGAVSTNVRGSVFRFVKVLNQFDRVWDLHLRGTDGILGMLPDEFSAFQPD